MSATKPRLTLINGAPKQPDVPLEDDQSDAQLAYDFGKSLQKPAPVTWSESFARFFNANWRRNA